MTIWKDFTFDSAHSLPKMLPGHPCKRLHGHTYRLRVFVSGPVHEETDMIVDYAVIAQVTKTVVSMIDHRHLNEIKGLENPTTEVLIKWIWDHLIWSLPQLSKLELSESSTTGCVYEGS